MDQLLNVWKGNIATMPLKQVAFPLIFLSSSNLLKNNNGNT